MDSKLRTIAKALTWQATGVLAVTLLGWAQLGFFAALMLALSSAATGLVAYVLHERVWNMVSWGRTEPLRRRGV